MDKYQEALDDVFSKHPMSKKRNLECKKLLQELVDKEKPMKLICKKSFGLYRTHCPRCNKVNNNIKDRCDNCGQRLDWSETNEN